MIEGRETLMTILSVLTVFKAGFFTPAEIRDFRGVEGQSEVLCQVSANSFDALDDLHRGCSAESGRSVLSG